MNLILRTKLFQILIKSEAVFSVLYVDKAIEAYLPFQTYLLEKIIECSKLQLRRISQY